MKFPRDFEHYMVTWICFHVKVLYYPLIAVRKKDIAPQLFWVQLRDTQKHENFLNVVFNKFQVHLADYLFLKQFVVFRQIKFYH